MFLLSLIPTNAFNIGRKVGLLVFISCLFSSPISAKEYKVEVLVFENLTQNQAYEPHTYEAPKIIESDAQTWSIEPSMLLEAAKSLQNSRDYLLLHHYSWGQETLPASEAAPFQIQEQNLNGWIKVYAKQLLFAKIDLDFNGYRVDEIRRLKLDEKHFIDHPKFGILLQVSRLEIEEPIN